VQVKIIHSSLYLHQNHITDTTERFTLERRIDELEREAAADVWPDVIDA
jgi:hypothetical protein